MTDKNKQKIPSKWNSKVVNSLAVRYDFTTRYIKLILNDERTPVFCDEIKLEYKLLLKEINAILNTDT